MPAGRPPKPTAEKLLNGNPGRRPISDDEPQFDGVPVMPDWLDYYAQELWELVVSDLVTAGVAKSVDGPALAGMCMWWGIWRKFDQLIQEGDLEYKTVCRAAMGWKQFSAIASKFGMTPSDRVRLKVSDKPPEEDDPLAAILKRRAERN